MRCIPVCLGDVLSFSTVAARPQPNSNAHSFPSRQRWWNDIPTPHRKFPPVRRNSFHPGLLLYNSSLNFPASLFTLILSELRGENMFPALVGGGSGGCLGIWMPFMKWDEGINKTLAPKVLAPQIKQNWNFNKGFKKGNNKSVIMFVTHSSVP